jgi:hypothetical protein
MRLRSSQGLRDVVNMAIDLDPANAMRREASLDSAPGGCTPAESRMTRAAPHGSKCFIGAKGTSQIEVCAALTRVRTQVKIASPPCNFWTRH